MLMSRVTGKNISDEDHLRQSIVDIITTPIGSRVMRRDYGSGLFRLVDNPIGRALYSKIRAEIADVLDKWEPRLIVSKIDIDATNMGQGQLSLGFEGLYLPQSRVVKLRDVTIDWKSAT